jgi:hypothetical protein
MRAEAERLAVRLIELIALAKEGDRATGGCRFCQRRSGLKSKRASVLFRKYTFRGQEFVVCSVCIAALNKSVTMGMRSEHPNYMGFSWSRQPFEHADPLWIGQWVAQRILHSSRAKAGLLLGSTIKRRALWNSRKAAK